MWRNKLFLLLIFVSTLLGENKNSSKFTIIAHMANSAEAVQWALKNGANGIEVDLNFKKNGELNYFKHGGFCDCDCRKTEEHICKPLRKNNKLFPCKAKENLLNMKNAIAENSEKLALIYIDSKLEKNINLNHAGENVISYLDTIFEKGFKGQAIISAPEKKYIKYLESVVRKIEKSAYKENYFITIDLETNDFKAATEPLIPLTKNRVYSTGISSCAAGNYYSQINLGKKNYDNGVFSGVGIWTIDNENAMQKYINLGVTSIMSNNPNKVLKVVNSFNLELAKPQESLISSTSNDLIVNPISDFSCKKNRDCKNKTCGRKSADDDEPLTCCKSGKLVSYGGYDYCSDMPDGNICWSDSMCLSGYCGGNWGGSRKGICGKSDVGISCDVDNNCKNKACGRITASDNAEKVCCSSGKTIRYGGYDYCASMPSKSVCWSDKMCASGVCKGNMSGLKKGKCK